MPAFKRFLRLTVVVLLAFVFWQVPAFAEENGLEGIESPPKTFSEALASMQQTLWDLWAGFVQHLPLLIAGLIAVVITWIAAKVISALVLKSLKKSGFRLSLRELMQQLAYVTTWVVGLMIAAVIVFPGLSPASALGGLGVLSLAISFAFKDLFENFFAGIMLLWKFPFEPGDFIECSGVTGKVENITIRITTIRQTTDELVVIPNSFLFTNPVEVLTNKPERRMTIMAGVAYDVDVEQAVSVIREAVTRCGSVSTQKDVQIFPNEFGDSSVNIEVAWWCGSTPLEQRRSRGEVITAIKQDLDAAGLEIPFPYRTLTFKEPLAIQQRSVDDQSNDG